MEKIQKQIDVMTKKIKNYDKKKLKLQIEMQQSKEHQTEQVTINIKTKKNSEKELIMIFQSDLFVIAMTDQLLF